MLLLSTHLAGPRRRAACEHRRPSLESNPRGQQDGRLVEYVTDGKGRRVGKMVSGVLTKQWIYRDQLKPVAELDGAGNLVSEFIYGTKGNAPDLVVRSGVTYRLVSDQLGSPVLAINTGNSSDIPFQATYAAFGERTLVAGTDDWMPLGFAGGQFDPDTKLTRFGARDYEAVAGRWTTKDRTRFGAIGTNFYQYALNAPVELRDETGRDVYLCQRPIRGWDDPDQSNRMNGPDFSGNPFHHDYFCVFQGGFWICGGQGASGSQFGSPGTNSPEEYKPGRCDQKSKDDTCVDDCVASAVDSGKRPHFDIRGGGFGTNCQEWADMTLRQCEESCANM